MRINCIISYYVVFEEEKTTHTIRGPRSKTAVGHTTVQCDAGRAVHV